MHPPYPPGLLEHFCNGSTSCHPRNRIRSIYQLTNRRNCKVSHRVIFCSDNKQSSSPHSLPDYRLTHFFHRVLQLYNVKDRDALSALVSPSKRFPPMRGVFHFQIYYIPQSCQYPQWKKNFSSQKYLNYPQHVWTIFRKKFFKSGTVPSTATPPQCVLVHISPQGIA